MAFIDELKIFAKAGKGGDGTVRWRHEKGKAFGGPSGGNGGRGGDVYALAVRDVHLLSKYRTKKEFAAENGGAGMKDSLEGANGEDLDISLPIGSLIKNCETGVVVSLLEEGERVLLLSGGRGGRGNESFKSSINRSPKEFTTGKEGQEGEFFIEVELVADIGLIGLPNAGKTSLLNALTSAKGKVGDYPFTTLEPNLGEMYGYILSDIPGLIEGAASGKGLGHKFLRHVKRTKVLAHLISFENEDPIKAYESVRKELADYSEELSAKEEIIVLTKTDVVSDQKYLDEVVKKFKKLSKDVHTLSLYDDASIKALEKVFLDKM